eukprot:3157031-Rhodomonas_salina.3
MRRVLEGGEQVDDVPFWVRPHARCSSPRCAVSTDRGYIALCHVRYWPRSYGSTHRLVLTWDRATQCPVLPYDRAMRRPVLT